MRFKKLIAAGGAFLLVLGASTLGAAAAYADDGTTSGDTVVTDTTTAADPVVETPPAPEPVVETPPASDPVEETPPASDPDPVVETTDPVESNTPSSESDSDPPADTSSGSSDSGSSDSGSSSGSTSTKTILSFTRTTATLKTFSIAGAPPVDNTNEVTYWENLYPGTTCYKDDTTYGSVTGDGLGVVLLPGTYAVLIVKSGNEDNGDGPGNAVFEDPTPGTTYYGPLNGGGQQGAVSHWIVCLTDGEEDVSVIPDAQGTNQTCDEVESELVGGSIQLTLMTGVTYTITGPNPDTTEIVPDGSGLATGLAPGTYDVSFVLDTGYTTSVVSPIQIVIGAFDGDCVSDPCDTGSTAPASLNIVEDCCDTTNVASLNTDTAPTCPLPDVWLCHATQANDQADNEFNGLTLPWQGALGHAFPPPGGDDHEGDIIPPFDYYENGVLKHFDGLNWDPSIDPDSEAWHDFVDAGCVEPEEVTPAAQAFPETCELLVPVAGHIEVTVISGVTYTVTGPDGDPTVIPLVNGVSGPVDPGEYLVAFSLDSGLTTSVSSPIHVTVDAFDGDCDLVEHPIVTPAAVAGSLSCLGVSSYTLSNDLDDPNAIKWTVNGSPLGIPLASPSSFTVSSPGVFNVHAEPNAPDYGLSNGAQQDWTFTFERPDDCDLDTLALTGQSPIAFLGGAMALILGGLALFRIRSMRRERPGSFI